MLDVLVSAIFGDLDISMIIYVHYIYIINSLWKPGFWQTISKSLMESWMDPQAGNGEKTWKDHDFPLVSMEFRPTWASLGFPLPLKALPNPVATDIRSVHGFCRRCAEFHVQLSGFLHQQVMPQLCGCRPTKPDIQRCWKHMCTSRAYVHPLTTCRNGEIHRDSFKTYTRLHGCVSAERVCVLYIYIYYIYVYILSYYVFLIFLDIFGAFIYTGPGYPACGVKDRLQARTCMPKATALLIVTNKLTGGLNHQKCGLYMQWTSWNPREMRISTN